MAILLLDALSQIFEPLLDIIVNNFLQSTSLHLRRHSCFTGLDRGALLLLLLRYGRRYSHLVRLRSWAHYFIIKRTCHCTDCLLRGLGCRGCWEYSELWISTHHLLLCKLISLAERLRHKPCHGSTSLAWWFLGAGLFLAYAAHLLRRCRFWIEILMDRFAVLQLVVVSSHRLVQDVIAAARLLVMQLTFTQRRGWFVVAYQEVAHILHWGGFLHRCT